MTAELRRLEQSNQRTVHWKRWGPYVSDRAWGTVREDYSASGDAWEYLPHDQARSKAYRWNEDGIAGICDRHEYLCFALALWNGRDPILKERLFGLTGKEGNHGEDVKEYYFYLDSTPTHSYMKFLYKYPQAEFPYSRLLEENRRRSKADPEFELMDTGVFNEDRYFDVVVEYAKASPEDILIRITATNRGTQPAQLHLLPTLWFRNTWSWKPGTSKPSLALRDSVEHALVEAGHPLLGQRWLYCCDHPNTLFCDNETNTARLHGQGHGPRYPKDAIHECVVGGNQDAVNPQRSGTKMAAQYSPIIAPGETATIRLRLTDAAASDDPFNGGLRSHLCLAPARSG